MPLQNQSASVASRLSFKSLAVKIIGSLLVTACLTGCGESQSVNYSAPVVSAPALTVPAPRAEVADERTEVGYDWPAFLGPQGDGTSRETGIDPSRWKPIPPLRWTLPLGTSYGGPAVVGTRLLQFDRFDDEERLTCVHTTTGEELWSWSSPVRYEDSYGYNNGPRCSPIVDDGLVFTYGVAGRLSCVELETGKPVWSKDLTEEYSVVQNFFGVASNPYVFHDLLLVMVGGSPQSSLDLGPSELDRVEPNGSAVVAFDKRTGVERYRLGDDLASYASLTVREIEGKPTGLAFARNGLLAFAPQTGEQLFEFPWRSSKLESVNAALPVTAGDRILLSECYEIGSVLLEVQQGQPSVVRRDQGSYRDLSFRAHWATPVVIDGYLYGCSGRNQPDCDFRCVRLSDGEVQWQVRTHERSSVLHVDGYLIVLGENGTLQLVRPNPQELSVVAEADLMEINDPQDGAPLLQPPCWAAPVLAHGLLYLRGRDRLVCLDLIPPQSD